MFLKRCLSLFMIFCLGIPSAAASEPWKLEIENFQRLNDVFYNICFDESGEFLKDSIIFQDGVYIDCNDQALALEKHFSALKANIEAFPAGNESMCAAPSPSEDPLQALSAKVSVNSCEKSNDEKCAEGLVCNALSSFMAGPVGTTAVLGLMAKGESLYSKLGLNLKDSPGGKLLKGCVAKGFQGDCALNLYRGIWDSLYTTVNGMWELVKFGYKKAKQGFNYVVDSIGGWFSEVEDSTSEKMMAAQGVDDSMLDQFLDDPLGFVADTAKNVYKAVVQASREHYGCEKWSGKPFVSQCLQPMTNWNCATCNQKMNVICGMGGFAVGEIFTAYLTGGASAATEVAVKSASRMGSKALGQVARALKIIPKADEAIKVATKAGDAATGAGKYLGKHFGRNALKAWKNLKASFTLKRVIKAAEVVKLDLAKGLKIAKRTLAYKAMSKAAKVGFSPFKTYFNLMDEAFNAGFYHTHKALNQGKKVLRLNTVSRIERTIKEKATPQPKVDTRALASDYANVVLKTEAQTSKGLEKAASEMHEVWKKHYSWKKDNNPELFVSFEKLPAEKKLETMDLLNKSLQAKGYTVNKDQFKTYILDLEVELMYEKLFLFLSKDNRVAEYLDANKLEGAQYHQLPPEHKNALKKLLDEANK